MLEKKLLIRQYTFLHGCLGLQALIDSWQLGLLWFKILWKGRVFQMVREENNNVDNKIMQTNTSPLTLTLVEKGHLEHQAIVAKCKALCKFLCVENVSL